MTASLRLLAPCSLLALAAACKIDNGLNGKPAQEPDFDTGDVYVPPVESGDTSEPDTQGARSLRAAGALLVRKFPAFADRSAVELLRGIARCDLLVWCHSPTTIASSMLPSPTFGRGWSRPWAG